MDITVKANRLKQNNGATIGIVNVNFGDMLKVRNITIKETENGRFLSMPSYQTNKVTEEGKPIYKDVFNPITSEGRKKLYDAIYDSFDTGKEVKLRDVSDNIEAKVVSVEDKGNGVIGIGRFYVADEFVVSNISVRKTVGKDGSERNFVAYPSYKSNEVGEDGKAVYKNFVYPASAEARDKLNEKVFNAFTESRELKDSQGKEEVKEEAKEEVKPKKGVKAKLKDGEEKKAKSEKKAETVKKDLEMAM